MNLVFLENIDEANILLKKIQYDQLSDIDTFKIISFHPLVKGYLSKRNITSEDSFVYCDSTSHETLLAVLDGWSHNMRQTCRLKDEYGVTISYSEDLLFYLRGVLSTWLYRCEVVQNVVGKYNPGRIITIGSVIPYASQGVWVDDSERLLSDIAKQVCAVCTIVHENIHYKNQMNKSYGFFKKVFQQWCLRFLIYLFTYIERKTKQLILVPFGGWDLHGLFTDMRRTLPPEYTIAVLNLPFKMALRYAIRYFLRKPLENYTYVPFDVDRKVPMSTHFIRERTTFEKTLLALFREWNYKSISAYEWIKRKYEKAYRKEVINKTYFQSVLLRRFIREKKPICACSTFSLGLTGVMGEVCKQEGVPALMMPHGSFVNVQNKYSQMEWCESARRQIFTPYSYLSVQTPLTNEFLKKNPVDSTLVVTGPLIYGRTIKKRECTKEYFNVAGKSVLLHASTPKIRTGQRFYNYETIDEYVDELIALVNAVNEVKDVHLVIRYRVMDQMGVRELESLLPRSQAYSIVTKGSFQDVLSCADLLMSYSSSTMEEALLNHIPVLLLNYFKRCQLLEGQVLDSTSKNQTVSPVYILNEKSEISYAIRWIVDNHILKNMNDGQLYERYRFRNNDITTIDEFIKKVTVPNNMSKEILSLKSGGQK